MSDLFGNYFVGFPTRRLKYGPPELPGIQVGQTILFDFLLSYTANATANFTYILSNSFLNSLSQKHCW